MLKLVESICYHYSPKRLVAETAWIIQIIITEIKGFAEENTLYTIFANFKKKEKKDWAFTSIFKSFLGKLNKSKEYVSIEDLIQVGNSDQTFKVFKKGAFDKKVHTLEDISNILGLLSERESLELK